MPEVLASCGDVNFSFSFSRKNFDDWLKNFQVSLKWHRLFAKVI